MQQEEEKVDEESDMDGDEEEAGVEEFTPDRFSDFSQSIAAEVRVNNKPFIMKSNQITCCICESNIYPRI